MVHAIVEQQMPLQIKNISAKKRYSTPTVAPQMQWLMQSLRSAPSASPERFGQKKVQ